jgi:hypothetical protein
VGPTYGALSAAGGGTAPAASVGFQLWQKDVTLPAAGAMYAFGHIRASLACQSTGSCSAQYGLYVDGTAVPGSGGMLSAGASGSDSRDIVMFGILPNVTAGAHTLKIGLTASGNWSSQGWGDREVGGILLGGAAAVAVASTPSDAAAPRSLTR